MNATMALLTAASVFVHAALGCCFDHSHAAGAVHLSVLQEPTSNQHHHVDHAHSCEYDHEHSGNDEPSPPLPHRHCDEGFCTALAGAAPETLLEPTQATFELAPPVELQAVAFTCSLHADYSSLQHDLGPPLRPHLCNLVLLI